MNEVQIRIERGNLKDTPIRELMEEVLEFLGFKNTELSILITDDKHIRELNRSYRGKDKATDVLSFPMGDEVGNRYILGDIAISYDTALKQAEEHGQELEQEVKRLLIHGLVHLLGYDHELGGEEEERFFNKEKEIHAFLGRR